MPSVAELALCDDFKRLKWGSRTSSALRFVSSARLGMSSAVILVVLAQLAVGAAAGLNREQLVVEMSLTSSNGHHAKLG